MASHTSQKKDKILHMAAKPCMSWSLPSPHLVASSPHSLTAATLAFSHVLKEATHLPVSHLCFCCPLCLKHLGSHLFNIYSSFKSQLRYHFLGEISSDPIEQSRTPLHNHTAFSFFSSYHLFPDWSCVFVWLPLLVQLLSITSPKLSIVAQHRVDTIIYGMNENIVLYTVFFPVVCMRNETSELYKRLWW